LYCLAEEGGTVPSPDVTFEIPSGEIFRALTARCNPIADTYLVPCSNLCGKQRREALKFTFQKSSVGETCHIGYIRYQGAFVTNCESSILYRRKAPASNLLDQCISLSMTFPNLSVLRVSKLLLPILESACASYDPSISISRIPSAVVILRNFRAFKDKF
jgi:hypothetical protein